MKYNLWATYTDLAEEKRIIYHILPSGKTPIIWGEIDKPRHECLGSFPYNPFNSRVLFHLKNSVAKFIVSLDNHPKPIKNRGLIIDSGSMTRIIEEQKEMCEAGKRKTAILALEERFESSKTKPTPIDGCCLWYN